LLFNNIGAAYLALGRRTEALEYFARARTDLGSYAPADLELTVIDQNLAMLTPEPKQRAALAEAAWHRLRDVLGDEHPRTLEALVAYSEYTPDPAVAYELMSKAAEAYRRFHPTLRRQQAVADTARAFLAAELGDIARTRTDYETAIATTRDNTDPDMVILRHLAIGELALAQNDPASVVAELEPIRDARLASERWYERVDGLRAEVDLGLAEAARGHDAEAIQHLDAAIAGYPAIIVMNEEVKFRRFYARAEHTLALTLRRLGKDPERAATLERDAARFYETAGAAAYRWILEDRQGSPSSR
jgi:tetratricopeptide (TPR) repeat protein